MGVYSRKTSGGAQETTRSPPEVRSAGAALGGDIAARRPARALAHPPGPRLGDRRALRAAGGTGRGDHRATGAPSRAGAPLPDSSLMVVDPLVQSAPGVSVVPVAAGRAFLAFGEGRGLADLGVAVLDRLQTEKTSPAMCRQLTLLHRQI